MHSFFEKIPLLEDQTFIIREYEVPAFNYPKHYHPEYEITLIKTGNGIRVVGEDVTNYEGGDLVMIGPGLPHQFKDHIHQSGQPLDQVVLQIHHSFLGNEYFCRSETDLIRQLFERSLHGIAFSHPVRQDAERLMKEIMQSNGFEALLKVQELLYIMACDKDAQRLSGSQYKLPGSKENDRINIIMHFITSGFHEAISLNDLASQFNISESAISHFIRKKTGKTFSQLLNEVRVGNACKLLTTTEASISEICFRSGMDNISYFNRKFKSIRGMTPSTFRKKYKT
jgi:YesN/AraC family two-component response regulator